MKPVNLLSNITHSNNSTHKFRMVHIRLPEHHVRALKIHAATVDSSVTRLVEAAVQQQYFTESKNSKAPKTTGKTAEASTETNSKTAKSTTNSAKSLPTKAKPTTSRRSETKMNDLELNVVPNPFAAE